MKDATVSGARKPALCIYCGQPSGDDYDEHQDCVEAALTAAVQDACGPCPICDDTFTVVIAGPDENGRYDTDDCPCQATSRRVAALYVETGGVYANLPDVEVWDEDRDARLYDGPWPVVAHPPCARWCQLAPINKARWGTPIGEDGGCFASALASVRRWGGVLEHPAHTIAWGAFGLPKPRPGSWQRSLDDVGWVTEVSQVAYGHPARKRTWLYLVGEPVALDWREPQHTHVVGAGIHTGESTWAQRDERSLETPPAFRDVLLEMARSAHRMEAAA